MLSSQRMLPSSKQHISMENFDKMWLSVTVLTFALPITIVCLCYVSIFKVARKQARKTTREIVKTPTKTVLQFVLCKITKLSKLGVSVVSCLPCLAVLFEHYFTGNGKCFYHKMLFVVWPWIEAIAFTSSALNLVPRGFSSPS